MKEVLTDVEILHKLLPSYKKYDILQVEVDDGKIRINGRNSKDIKTIFTECIKPIKYSQYIQYETVEDSDKALLREEEERYNKEVNLVTNLKFNYYKELRNRKIEGLL